ncbi:MAG: hypothetical protein ACXWJM_09055 [Ramlibacter sp.]
MRFSAAIQSHMPLRDVAATDLLRRLLSTPVPQSEPARELPERDLAPLDPDQRVRLVGEW